MSLTQAPLLSCIPLASFRRTPVEDPVFIGNRGPEEALGSSLFKLFGALLFPGGWHGEPSSPTEFLTLIWTKFELNPNQGNLKPDPIESKDRHG